MSNSNEGLFEVRYDKEGHVSGIRYLGRPTSPTAAKHPPVVYLNAEDNEDENLERIEHVTWDLLEPLIFAPKSYSRPTVSYYIPPPTAISGPQFPEPKKNNNNANGVQQQKRHPSQRRANVFQGLQAGF
jgi:hypothetical protein